MHSYLPGRSTRLRTISNEVVARGKKRLKRKGRLRIQEAVDFPPMTFKEHLMFGRMMGESVEEVLDFLKKQSETGKLDLDPEAKAYIEKIEEKKAAKARMLETMKRVTSGDLEWEEMKEKLGDAVKTVPVWATAKKYNIPEVRYEDLLPVDDDEEKGMSDYGRFLLNEEEEIPEDFEYKDLELMISQLPDNLIRNGRWYDDEVPTVFQATKPEASPKKKRPVPALAPRPLIHGPVFEQEKKKREHKEKEAKQKIQAKKAGKPTRLIRPTMPMTEDDTESDDEILTVGEVSMAEQIRPIQDSPLSEQTLKKTVQSRPLVRPSKPKVVATERQAIQPSTKVPKSATAQSTGRRKGDASPRKPKKAVLKKPPTKN